MKKPILITGLDIGSSKVSGLVAEADTDGTLKIVVQEFQPSKGVSRGAIVDLNETIDSVSKVFARLRYKTSNKAFENIYVNITGESIKGEKSKGMIPLSLRGREITKADINKCINVASTIQLPFDRDIIHRIVQKFSIDDQPWIKNPHDLYASRLACEVYIITASVNHIQNIYKCVNNAGYDVREVVYTGIAKGESLLDPEEKETGAIILDMGATLTEMSIFSNGALRDIDIIPFGGQDFKGDFKDSGGFKNVLSRIKSKIENFLSEGGSAGSITLTGGLSFADGIAEFLEESLSYPVRMGIVKNITGDISSLDSIRGAAAIGLVRYAHKKFEKKVLEDRNIVQRISTKVVDIFNNYF